MADPDIPYEELRAAIDLHDADFEIAVAPHLLALIDKAEKYDKTWKALPALLDHLIEDRDD